MENFEAGEILVSLLNGEEKAAFSKMNTEELRVLQSLAESHGVLPYLVRQLGSVVPIEYEKRVRELSARGLEYVYEIERIAAILAEQNIQGIFFKGVVLGWSVFAEPLDRVLNDIDILIAAKDIDTFEAAMQGPGYEVAEEKSELQAGCERKFRDSREYFSKKTDISLDVHWKLFKDFYGAAIFAQDFFEGFQELQIGKAVVLAPAPVQHFKYLCLHGGKHSWNELKWVLDIHLLLKQYPALLTREQLALTDSIKRPVYLALMLTQKVFNQPLPEWLWNGMQNENGLAELSDFLIERIKNDEELDLIDSCRVDLWLQGSVRRKITYLFRRIVTPHAEDWRSLALPDSLFFLYYVVRPCRLCWRYIVRRCFCKSSAAIKSL